MDVIKATFKQMTMRHAHLAPSHVARNCRKGGGNGHCSYHRATSPQEEQQASIQCKISVGLVFDYLFVLKFS